MHLGKIAKARASHLFVWNGDQGKGKRPLASLRRITNTYALENNY